MAINAVKYTTATIVKDRIYGRTGLSTAQVEEIIKENEGWIDTIIRNSATGGDVNITFADSKDIHLFLRKWATALSTIDVLMASSLSFTSLTEMKDIWNMCVWEHEECVKWIESQKGTNKFIAQQ